MFIYIYTYISFLYVSSIQKLCFLSCIKALGHVKHNKMHFLCGCLTTRVDMASVRIVAALIKKTSSCLGSVGLEAFESQSHAAAGRVL